MSVVAEAVSAATGRAHSHSTALPPHPHSWVFAGTLTSGSRSIGIPTRPMTNFDSAHEHKNNKAPYYRQVCDTYWKTKGESAVSDDSRASSCSVWNFHVWCDGKPAVARCSSLPRAHR